MTSNIARLSADNFTFNMWGGRWIPSLKKWPLQDDRPIGESWEFSTHREHPSRLIHTDGSTRSLRDAIGADAPFLLKFIDSADDLSVQVHPSDDYARRHAGDSGKAESWIILDVGNNSDDGFIYLGFDPKKVEGYKTTDDFQEAFFNAINQANLLGPSDDAAVREQGARLILPFLNKIRVKPGEAYNVPPGTIHAIGRGVRLFEIQQSSDVTYRVWDWNRPDVAHRHKGKLMFRPLHIDHAQHVLDFHAHAPAHYALSAERVDAYEEKLIKNTEARFACHRLAITKGQSVEQKTNGAYQVLTVVAGEIELPSVGILKAGYSAFVPAGVTNYVITSVFGATVLKSYEP